MNHLELLFASAVLERALLIKTAARNAFYKNFDDDQKSKDQALEKWMNENPTANFVPTALAAIQNVAEQIRSLE